MRIVVLEDHLMFREVLRKLCTDELRHRVVAEAADGNRAVEVVADTRPDLVLPDLLLSGLDGSGVRGKIRELAPTNRILVLSSRCDEYTVFRTEQTHVNGFVDKNTNAVVVSPLTRFTA